jgi:membrane protein YdbS with pleckstrin-like domain
MTSDGDSPDGERPDADAPGADTWRRLDPGLLRLRRLETVVLLGVLTVVVALAVGLAAGRVWAAAVLVAGAVLVVLALRAVHRRFHAWGWAEREDDLLLRRGVLVRSTTVVPYGRMQFVDVTAGPLDRRYGVAKVVLHTAAAATDASIPGLRADEADRLRDRLAALGEARAAGV